MKIELLASAFAEKVDDQYAKMVSSNSSDGNNYNTSFGKKSGHINMGSNTKTMSIITKNKCRNKITREKLCSDKLNKDLSCLFNNNRLFNGDDNCKNDCEYYFPSSEKSETTTPYPEQPPIKKFRNSEWLTSSSTNTNDSSLDVIMGCRTDPKEYYGALKNLWFCNSGIHPRNQAEMLKKLLFRNTNRLWLKIYSRLVGVFNLWGVLNTDTADYTFFNVCMADSSVQVVDFEPPSSVYHSRFISGDDIISMIQTTNMLKAIKKENQLSRTNPEQYMQQSIFNRRRKSDLYKAVACRETLSSVYDSRGQFLTTPFTNFVTILYTPGTGVFKDITGEESLIKVNKFDESFIGKETYLQTSNFVDTTKEFIVALREGVFLPVASKNSVHYGRTLRGICGNFGNRAACRTTPGKFNKYTKTAATQSAILNCNVTTAMDFSSDILDSKQNVILKNSTARNLMMTLRDAVTDSYRKKNISSNERNNSEYEKEGIDNDKIKHNIVVTDKSLRHLVGISKGFILDNESDLDSTNSNDIQYVGGGIFFSMYKECVRHLKEMTKSNKQNRLNANRIFLTEWLTLTIMFDVDNDKKQASIDFGAYLNPSILGSKISVKSSSLFTKDASCSKHNNGGVFTDSGIIRGERILNVAKYWGDQSSIKNVRDYNINSSSACFLANPCISLVWFLRRSPHLRYYTTNAGVARISKLISAKDSTLSHEDLFTSGTLTSFKIYNNTSCVSIDSNRFFLIDGSFLLGGRIEYYNVLTDIYMRSKLKTEKHVIYSSLFPSSVISAFLASSIEGNTFNQGLALLEHTSRLRNIEANCLTRKDFWSLDSKSSSLNDSSINDNNTVISSIVSPRKGNDGNNLMQEERQKGPLDENVIENIVMRDEEIEGEKEEYNGNDEIQIMGNVVINEETEQVETTLTPPSILAPDETYVFLKILYELARLSSDGQHIVNCDSFSGKNESADIGLLALRKCYIEVVDQINGMPRLHALYILRSLLNFGGFIHGITTGDGEKSHHLVYTLGMIGMNMVSKTVLVLVGTKGNNLKSTLIDTMKGCWWSLHSDVPVSVFNGSGGSASSTQANLAYLCGNKITVISDEVGYQGPKKYIDNSNCDNNMFKKTSSVLEEIKNSEQNGVGEGVAVVWSSILNAIKNSRLNVCSREIGLIKNLKNVGNCQKRKRDMNSELRNNENSNNNSTNNNNTSLFLKSYNKLCKKCEFSVRGFATNSIWWNCSVGAVIHDLDEQKTISNCISYQEIPFSVQNIDIIKTSEWLKNDCFLLEMFDSDGNESNKQTRDGETCNEASGGVGLLYDYNPYKKSDILLSTKLLAGIDCLSCCNQNNDDDVIDEFKEFLLQNEGVCNHNGDDGEPKSNFWKSALVFNTDNNSEGKIYHYSTVDDNCVRNTVLSADDVSQKLKQAFLWYKNKRNSMKYNDFIKYLYRRLTTENFSKPYKWKSSMGCDGEPIVCAEIVDPRYANRLCMIRDCAQNAINLYSDRLLNNIRLIQTVKRDKNESVYVNMDCVKRSDVSPCMLYVMHATYIGDSGTLRPLKVQKTQNQDTNNNLKKLLGDTLGSIDVNSPFIMRNMSNWLSSLLYGTAKSTYPQNNNSEYNDNETMIINKGKTVDNLLLKLMKQPKRFGFPRLTLDGGCSYSMSTDSNIAVIEEIVKIPNEILQKCGSFAKELINDTLESSSKENVGETCGETSGGGSGGFVNEIVGNKFSYERLFFRYTDELNPAPPKSSYTNNINKSLMMALLRFNNKGVNIGDVANSIALSSMGQNGKGKSVSSVEDSTIEADQMLPGQFNSNILKRLTSPKSCMTLRGLHAKPVPMSVTLTPVLMSNSYTYQFFVDTALLKRMLIFSCDTQFVFDCHNDNIGIMKSLACSGLRAIHSDLLVRRAYKWMKKDNEATSVRDVELDVIERNKIQNVSAWNTSTSNYYKIAEMTDGLNNVKTIASITPSILVRHLIENSVLELKENAFSARIEESGNTFFQLYTTMMLSTKTELAVSSSSPPAIENAKKNKVLTTKNTKEIAQSPSLLTTSEDDLQNDEEDLCEIYNTDDEEFDDENVDKEMYICNINETNKKKNNNSRKRKHETPNKKNKYRQQKFLYCTKTEMRQKIVRKLSKFDRAGGGGRHRPICTVNPKSLNTLQMAMEKSRHGAWNRVNAALQCVVLFDAPFVQTYGLYGEGCNIKCLSSLKKGYLTKISWCVGIRLPNLDLAVKGYHGTSFNNYSKTSGGDFPVIGAGSALCKQLVDGWGTHDIRDAMYSCFHLNMLFELVLQFSASKRRLNDIYEYKNDPKSDYVSMLFVCKIYREIMRKSGFKVFLENQDNITSVSVNYEKEQHRNKKTKKVLLATSPASENFSIDDTTTPCEGGLEIPKFMVMLLNKPLALLRSTTNLSHCHYDALKARKHCNNVNTVLNVLGMRLNPKYLCKNCINQL